MFNLSVQDLEAVVAILVVAIGFIIWLVKVDANSKSGIAAVEKALDTYVKQCEKERTDIKSGRTDGDKNIWEAMNEIKNSMNTGFIQMGQAIGRLEGRMENHK